MDYGVAKKGSEMIYHKFNAIRTEIEGIKFASKKEADYYKELCLRRSEGGDIIFFLRQVPFHLPGGTKHIIDFVTFNRDGTVRFIEIKGYDTPMGKMKRKMVEELYPIKIEVI